VLRTIRLYSKTPSVSKSLVYVDTLETTHFAHVQTKCQLFIITSSRLGLQLFPWSASCPTRNYVEVAK